MPHWWGRKSPKTPKQQPKPQLNTFNLSSIPSPKTKHSISAPPASEIDEWKTRCHPLPRPSAAHDQATLLASASTSVSASSASSSASSDDPSLDFGFTGCHRGHIENTFSPRTRSPGPGSRSPKPVSPLHPQLCVRNLESAPGIQENGRSLCLPLPRPPASPTHQSTMSSIRNSESIGSSQCLVSNWKKGKLLGRGTFGHVYVGFNSEKGKMCAIKEVKLVSDDQNSKECLKQLNQEITLLGQLSHKNIVQYYGSELGEETLSVFLEYVTGGSIHKLLQEYGPFKEPVIRSYTRQILLGLAYLHGRNTVHRDIKGANILVGPNGEVKLADFGMAKLITSNNSVLSFKGSPYWMAPEVIMNISGHSLAVDIWSLGCTVLEMATSKPPWSHFEGVAAIFKIGNSKDIPEIPDHLSNDAKNFLKLCLQRDPSARPTASQLLDHPFIRDRTATKTPNTNIVDNIVPTPLDVSHTTTTFNMHCNRKNMSSQNGDNRIRPAVRSSPLQISFKQPMNTMSLPGSPCSSPLRQYGPAHRSCFLSPPPSYMSEQVNYGPTSHLFTSARQYLNHPSDQWGNISQCKAQTPVAYSRRQPF